MKNSRRPHGYRKTTDGQMDKRSYVDFVLARVIRSHVYALCTFSTLAPKLTSGML